MAYFIKPASDYRPSPIFTVFKAMSYCSLIFWLLILYMIKSVNFWCLEFLGRVIYLMCIWMCVGPVVFVFLYMTRWISLLDYKESFCRHYWSCYSVPKDLKQLMLEEYEVYIAKLNRMVITLPNGGRNVIGSNVVDAAGYFTFSWFSRHKGYKVSMRRKEGFFEKLSTMTLSKFSGNVENDFYNLCTQLAGISSIIVYTALGKSAYTVRHDAKSYEKLYDVAQKYFHLQCIESADIYGEIDLSLNDVLVYFIKMAFKAILAVVQEHEEEFKKLLSLFESKRKLQYNDLKKILGPGFERKSSLLEEFCYYQLSETDIGTNAEPTGKQTEDFENRLLRKRPFKKIVVQFQTNQIHSYDYVRSVTFPGNKREEHFELKSKNKKKNILIPSDTQKGKSVKTINILEESTSEETDDYLLPVCIETEKVNVRITMENENYSTSISRIVYDELKNAVNQANCSGIHLRSHTSKNAL